MMMSQAERMRRFRKKRDEDPQKREEYLEKERIRSARRRTKINDLESRREKKALRSKWKETKRRQRQTLKAVQRLVTPPMSPDEHREPGPSRQRIEGTRRQRRERSASRQLVKDLERRLTNVRKRSEMFRKRAERLKTLRNHDDGTPRTRTRRTMKHSSLKNVKKTLLFHNVLVDQLKSSYKNSNNRIKRSLSQTVAGKLLQKYGMRGHAEKTLDINVRTHLKPKSSLTRRLQLKIQQFFERDDNSRMTSGKKETVTYHKLKKQKRLLNDTVSNLHRKFQAENPTPQVSFTSFWRMKPFWIKKASEYERDTCLCKIHDNFRLMTEKLNSLKVLSSPDPENVVMGTTCDITNKTCMYGECQKCMEPQIDVSDHDENQEVTWLHWAHVKERREIKSSGVKDVFITAKREESGSLTDLVQSFQDQLPKFKRHLFTMKNQFLHYRNIHRDLTDKECILHVDFAENYQGKLASEIQAMHFGASKTQITLHTGVLYTKDGHKSYCTVSDSLEHGPAAIWAHLIPVLTDVRNDFPMVESIHFYSDGPTSQYRQKGNFYHFSSIPFEMGFSEVDWNYFEAGHGKGAPDGIGGALKRRADEIVRCGASISNASTFVSTLKKARTSVNLFEIVGQEIQAIEKLKKITTLDPVPGTLRIHQVISEAPYTIFYRDISCSCTHISPCSLHECRKFTFPVKNSKRQLPPVTPPMAPFTPPMAPVTPPMAPVTPPMAPVTPPMAPVTPSMAPVTPPMAPVTPPMAPVTPPMALVTPPTAPVTPPTAPVTPPMPPVTPPMPPVTPPMPPVTPPIPPINPPEPPMPPVNPPEPPMPPANPPEPPMPPANPPEPPMPPVNPPEPPMPPVNPPMPPVNPPEPPMPPVNPPEPPMPPVNPPEPPMAQVNPPEPSMPPVNPLEPPMPPANPPMPPVNPPEPSMPPVNPPEPPMPPANPLQPPMPPANPPMPPVNPPEPSMPPVNSPEPPMPPANPPEPPMPPVNPPMPPANPPEPPMPPANPPEPPMPPVNPPMPPVPPAETLVNKFVIVVYEGKAYPGRVLDFDKHNELYVECMHPVSKGRNCFFWPRFKDKCWYNYDTSVLACIGEPQPIKGKGYSKHREVDPKIWAEVQRRFNTANMANVPK